MKNSKSGLTPAKKKFAEVYARTDNATKAVKVAFKDNNYSSAVAGVKGARLLKNDNISQEIDRQKQRMEKLSGESVDRFGELIRSENENIAFSTGKFIYEQVHGKALSRNVSLGITTTVEDALYELE